MVVGNQELDLTRLGHWKLLALRTWGPRGIGPRHYPAASRHATADNHSIPARTGKRATGILVRNPDGRGKASTATGCGDRVGASVFNPCLHHHPRLEDDVHFAGTMIFSPVRGFGPCGASATSPQNAEVAKLHPTVRREYVHDGIEDLLDNVPGLKLCDSKFLGNRLDDLSWSRVKSSGIG